MFQVQEDYKFAINGYYGRIDEPLSKMRNIQTGKSFEEVWAELKKSIVTPFRCHKCSKEINDPVLFEIHKDLKDCTKIQ